MPRDFPDWGKIEKYPSYQMFAGVDIDTGIVAYYSMIAEEGHICEILHFVLYIVEGEVADAAIGIYAEEIEESYYMEKVDALPVNVSFYLANPFWINEKQGVSFYMNIVSAPVTWYVRVIYNDFTI